MASHAEELPTQTLQAAQSARAEDVRFMASALEGFAKGEREFNAGSAGTVLRFLAARLSREAGTWRIYGRPGLLERPQSELVRVLGALGVLLRSVPGGFEISGEGWQTPTGEMRVERGQSSQFLSALLLNAWNLPQDLRVSFEAQSLSDSYLKMTLDFVARAGMRWEDRTADGIRTLTLLARQFPAVANDLLEPDMSSAFTVAAHAALFGEAHFEAFPDISLQGDAVFLDILEQMGAEIRRTNDTTSVLCAPQLRGIEWNLASTPDLFPVLAVTAALARGSTRLFGAPQLAFKESNRIEKIRELIELMGLEASIEKNAAGEPWGLSFRGPARPENFDWQDFDCEDDHRLVMALSLARRAAFRIQGRNIEAVNKSFPEFREIAPWL